MELDFRVQSFGATKNEGLSNSSDEYNLVPQSKGAQTFIKKPLKFNKIFSFFPPTNAIKTSRYINPFPPIGIEMLKAVLEKKNYAIKILDCLIRGWNQRENSTVSR